MNLALRIRGFDLEDRIPRRYEKADLTGNTDHFALPYTKPTKEELLDKEKFLKTPNRYAAVS